jgi:hypothetical protein
MVSLKSMARHGSSAVEDRAYGVGEASQSRTWCRRMASENRACMGWRVAESCHRNGSRRQSTCIVASTCVAYQR